MLKIIAILLCLSFAQDLHANIYQAYTDDGVLYFTNAPTDPQSKKVIHINKTTSPPPKFSKASQRATYHKAMLHDIILQKSQRYNVDPKLVHTVIKHESNWNPLAVSPKGAMGLMQLMPATAQLMGVSDPFDPVQNIEGGIKYLSQMIELFNGNLALALAAYNAGPKTVQKVGRVPSISETLNYVRNVMRDYQGSFEFTKAQRDIIYKIVHPDGTLFFTNVPHLRVND